MRSVHKLGAQAGGLQEKINSLLISAARDGHHVVRLRGNGQLPSARADEEAQALAQAGVDFEVIPGAESVMGAAAGTNSR